MSNLAADKGSFRDPLSRVFVTGDDVIRGFSAMGKSDIDAVWSKKFISDALASGELIASEFVDSASVGLDSEWVAAMRHPRLPFVSYPYEWSFNMLKDAALTQLRLTRAALADGVGVKDATPYNVQFVGSRPVFIDAGSFEVRKATDPWYGYKQFCEMFLYPLMLQSYLGVQFQPFMRGAVNGVSPDTMRKLLPMKLLRPRKGRLIHVVLHAAAQNKFADTKVDVKKQSAKAGMSAAVLDATLRKLEKLVGELSLHDKESTWSEYSERAHYVESSLDEKERFVRDAVASSHRHQVWDIGCNDGRFSRIASAHSDHVVAMDADPLVVDRLYQSLRNEKNTSILPLYVDLSDSGGGIGWRGIERPGIFDRGKPDVVLFLAVIHHVAITFNIPVAAQLDLLRNLTPEIVIEFPHADDPMVKRLLLNKRDGIHSDFNLAEFERLLGERFDVRSKMLLSSGTRTIFHATRKS
ncbi:MAG: class I SAM-dependent methyltransferase [Actinobacteria bacterium]|nr:class I SAM-dependent methyltransferase [Actinomycetota bacterium]